MMKKREAKKLEKQIHLLWEKIDNINQMYLKLDELVEQFSQH